MSHEPCRFINRTPFDEFDKIEILARVNDFEPFSLKEETLKELDQAFKDSDLAEKDVLLCASGRVFCSGLDRVDLFRAILRKKSCEEPLGQLIRLYLTILSRTKRTVCSVRGSAFAGGVGLAACCDYIMASENAKFEIPGGYYTPLAKILVPVLRARTTAMKGKPPKEWIGWKASAKEAETIKFLDGTTDLAERAKPGWEAKMMQQCLQLGKPRVRQLRDIEAEMADACKRALRPEVTFPLGVKLCHQLMGLLIDGLE